MTEDDARAWIADKFGSSGVDRIAQFLDYVIAENRQQNLVSPSTIETIWVRHALDSAQLALIAPPSGLRWLDIGSGGGFPGLIAAILRPESVMLIEPRKRRADFLVECVNRLALADRVSIKASRMEKITIPAGTISARAVSSIGNLLEIATQCSTSETVWVLPRGKLAPEDMASLRQSWHFVFHVEQSITNRGSSILVLREVSRR